ncbi:antibiotic biosynthesis monooxygenase [Streptacidiphilus sp. ASG 303]|uniref:antibiotic biosynthesis monooxygenase family protein n=1 Tax=Streptacidiphilus sp. ASG 303 TaxID=2896847 RepID=UPI001E54BE17|nr:antibiotic biosynthesis monooxygenase family protein [Streptacidiphilus sp. ASG 303]MCD0485149.1 antibiotic biosynthesis monooxygenase [Streptacidiphilus sp. ASG 303]
MNEVQNNGATPLAVVAVFRLKGDAAEFEQLLAEQGELMQADAGFRFGILARSAESPDTYVNIAWWRDSVSYLTVVRSYAFASRAMSGIGRLADTRIDRLAALEPDGTLLPADGAEQGLLELAAFDLPEDADRAGFEQRLSGQAASLAARDDVAQVALARSLVRPGGYTALSWRTADGPAADDWPAWAAGQETGRYRVVSVVAPVAV